MYKFTVFFCCYYLQPVTSSTAFLLGEIVDNRQSAAQPLVKLFLHHGKLVPLIHALADWEMSNTMSVGIILFYKFPVVRQHVLIKLLI